MKSQLNYTCRLVHNISPNLNLHADKQDIFLLKEINQDAAPQRCIYVIMSVSKNIFLYHSVERG